jgi:transcriptional regulator with XRE-family HTH domain
MTVNDQADAEDAPASGDATAHRLGQKLKKLREYLGMSQQHVAERTGIPRSAVSDIERGQRKVDTVELTKFARLYQYPVSWLLDENEHATADTHALAMLARKFSRLTEEDQAQLAEFADFLAARRGADQQPLSGQGTW